MELDRQRVERILNFIPTEFILYQQDEGRLIHLRYSSGIPAMVGYTEEEFQTIFGQQVPHGEETFCFVCKDDRHTVWTKIGQCCPEQTDQECLYRLQHKNKYFVWTRARFRYIGEIEGKRAVVAVFFNVSQEWAMNEVLLDHMHRRILVIDRQTKEILYANRKTAAGDGAAYMGRICYEYIWGKKHPCSFCRMGQNCRDSYPAEWYDAAGKSWFAIFGQWISWGNREAYAEFIEDITDRKNADNLLKEGMADMTTILQNIPAGLTVLQIREGKAFIITVNSYFYSLFELKQGTPAHTLEKTLLPLVYPADLAGMRQWLAELAAGKTRAGRTCRMVMAVGKSWRHIYWQGRLVRQADGTSYIYMSYSDVSALKQTMASLRDSRQQYRMAVEETRLSVCEYDIVHHQLKLSDTDPLFSGLSNRCIDNIPDSLLPYIDPDSREDVRRMYRELEEGKDMVQTNLWCSLFGEKERRCIHLTYYLDRDEKGKPVTAFGIVQDVTAEQYKQKNYEYFLANLLNIHPQAVHMLYLNLTTNSCIKGRRQTTNMRWPQDARTVDDCFAGIFLNIPLEEDRDRVYPVFSRTYLLEQYRQGQTEVARIYRYRQEDGIVRWTRSELQMAQNSKNGHIEAVLYSMNIDDDIKENKIVQYLIENEYDFIGIIHVNKKQMEFCNVGHSLTGFVQNSLTDYESGMDRIIEKIVITADAALCRSQLTLAHVQEYLKNNPSYELSFFANGTGQRRYRKQIQYMYLGERQEDILITMSDVTQAYREEAKRMQRLQNALLVAEKANQARSKFLSDMSHDMRTPLNGITGFADLAREKIDLSASVHIVSSYLEKIKDASDFLLNIINDTLDLSKMESGKMSLLPRTVSIRTLIRKVLAQTQAVQKSRNIYIDVDFNPSVPIYVIADEKKLQKLIAGFLLYALFSSRPGGNLLLQIEWLYTETSKRKFQFSVNYMGTILDEKAKKNIFEPFAQENYGQGQYEGTGLGLTISRQLVDLMGGSVTVQSCPDEGTTFTIDLSLMPGEQVPQPQKWFRPVLSGRHILLCEDHPLNAEMVRILLEKQGVIVFYGANGREGVQIFASSPIGDIDVILMDMHMPVLNGWEAIKKIRGLPRTDASTVPIVALTGASVDEYEGQEMDCLINGYIGKPFQAAELFQKIASFL